MMMVVGSSAKRLTSSVVGRVSLLTIAQVMLPQWLLFLGLVIQLDLGGKQNF